MISHSQIHGCEPRGYVPRMALKLRIRELRQARGWSLEVLAARIGVSVPHLSEVERGKKNLNNHLIDSLSQELDVEPFELFAPRQGHDALTDVFRQLDADDLARVEAFAAALASTRKPDGQ